MSDWPFFVDVVGIAATILVMLVLGWAAIERGRIHRVWVPLRRDPGWKIAQSIDWSMAMAVAAGCA